MPRKMTEDDDDGEVHAPVVISKEKTEKFVKQFERLDEQVDKIMTQAVKAAQPFKDDQKEVVKKAAEAGIPKAELRAVLRERKLRRKVEAVRDSLNENQRDTFDRIKLALGMQLDLFGPAPTAKKAKSKGKSKSKPDDAPAETAGESFAASQMSQLQQ